MALKLWKEKERGNLEQGSGHCTQALPVTWIHKRNSANDFEPVSHLKVCTLSTILSASEVHDYILTFELLLIMRTINILGRKRKLSNVGSVVRLTFGLSNLPSLDQHSHSYWRAEAGGGMLYTKRTSVCCVPEDENGHVGEWNLNVRSHMGSEQRGPSIIVEHGALWHLVLWKLVTKKCVTRVY